MTDQDIYEAARDGDVEALGRELAKGVSPNSLSQDLSGTWTPLTPLHLVCHRGDNAKARLACLHVLLEAGANVNVLDAHQRTPLHFAAGRGHAKVVAALIKAGADVNRGDAVNRTPLHWACSRIDSDVEPAWVLIKNGAEVDARTCHGQTPLECASVSSYSSHRRFVPILLRAGATLPAHTTNAYIDAYIQKMIAAGGFRQYERNHLDALAATFAPHFAYLPPEIVRLVVECAFHVGDY